MKRLIFNPHTHSIILKVELEHIRKFTVKMLFDPGASFTLITPETAWELGYDLSKLPTTTLFTASKQERTPVLHLKTMTLAGETIHSVEARCLSLPQGLNIDGLLGLNFLRHFNITLDFEHGELTLQKFKKSQSQNA